MNLYCNYFGAGNLEEINDRGECHVQGNHKVYAECKTSGRLWYDDDGIDDRVHDASNGCNFEQNCGEHHTGIREHVE